MGSAALASSALLLIAIGALRVRLLRSAARERKLASTWSRLIAECMLGMPQALPQVAAADAEAFLLLWCRAQESIRGDARERLVELARRVGAAGMAQRLLRSNRPASELLGLVALGHMRESSVLPLLGRLLTEAPALISLTAAQAFARIAPAAAVHEILAATVRRDDWPLSSVASILKDLDPAEVAAELSLMLCQDPVLAPAAIERLLRLHGTAQPERLRGAVIEVLKTSADAQVLAAALGAVWHPDEKARVKELASHPDWHVRLAAARALARLGAGEDRPVLEALLKDPVWWVRYRAAGAVCSAIPELAEELARTLDDAYAGDALRQALADRAFS